MFSPLAPSCEEVPVVVSVVVLCFATLSPVDGRTMLGYEPAHDSMAENQRSQVVKRDLTSKLQTQRNKTKLTIDNDIMPALSGQNVQVEEQAESSDETDIVSGYPDGVVW